MNQKKSRIKWDGSFARSIELFFDMLVVIFSIFLMYSIQLFVDNSYEIHNIVEFFISFDTYFMIPSLIVTNIMYVIIIGFFFAIYRATAIDNTYFQTLTATYLSLFISFVTVVVADYIFTMERVTLPTMVSMFFVQAILFAFVKYLGHHFFFKRTRKSILVIGTSSDMKLYLPKFFNKLPEGRTLQCVIEDNGSDLSRSLPYIHQVNMVYVMPHLNESLKSSLVNYCMAQDNLDVCLIPRTYEVGIYDARLETVDDAMIYRIEKLEISLTNRFFKRTFDLVLSVIGILLASPFFLIVPIIIKLSDKGPALYKQERITRNQKPFMLYKFRTMVTNAEELSGAVWAQDNDPRITKIGKFLRRFRLDELPQLFNVLKGEMSFVGPRPERQIFIDEFSKTNPHFNYRLNVKAGITGMAQIYGKYNTSPDDKLRFDLFYIRNYSFLRDIKFILLTIKSVFKMDSTEGLNDQVDYQDLLNKHPEVKHINYKLN